MFSTHLVIYLILVGAAFIAWKKYHDKFLLWCLEIGAILIAATIWQYVAINVLVLPAWLELANLLAIEALRVLIVVLLVIAAIRIFKPSH
jgi:hypothetical protein